MKLQYVNLFFDQNKDLEVPKETKQVILLEHFGSCRGQSVKALLLIDDSDTLIDEEPVTETDKT